MAFIVGTVTLHLFLTLGYNKAQEGWTKLSQQSRPGLRATNETKTTDLLANVAVRETAWGKLVKVFSRMGDDARLKLPQKQRQAAWLAMMQDYMALISDDCETEYIGMPELTLKGKAAIQADLQTWYSKEAGNPAGAQDGIVSLKVQLGPVHYKTVRKPCPMCPKGGTPSDEMYCEVIFNQVCANGAKLVAPGMMWLRVNSEGKIHHQKILFDSSYYEGSKKCVPAAASELGTKFMVSKHEREQVDTLLTSWGDVGVQFSNDPPAQAAAWAKFFNPTEGMFTFSDVSSLMTPQGRGREGVKFFLAETFINMTGQSMHLNTCHNSMHPIIIKGTDGIVFGICTDGTRWCKSGHIAPWNNQFNLVTMGRDGAVTDWTLYDSDNDAQTYDKYCNVAPGYNE